MKRTARWRHKRLQKQAREFGLLTFVEVNVSTIRFLGYRLGSRMRDSDIDRSGDDSNIPVSTTIAESDYTDADDA